jgi:hypothetical protein
LIALAEASRSCYIASVRLSLISALAVLVLIACLVVAERRGRLLTACAGILAALGTAWGLALVAVENDYRDADGFVDCWPYCSPLQEAVGATPVYGPLAALLVILTTTVVAVLRRRRTRDATR